MEQSSASIENFQISSDFTPHEDVNLRQNISINLCFYAHVSDVILEEPAVSSFEKRNVPTGRSSSTQDIKSKAVPGKDIPQQIIGYDCVKDWPPPSPDLTHNHR
ncbi:hypothetical protein AVEN_134900-1 [Araneus ventricosus]|uniref:Uncharacterized protein n=1 Tax=Araneus ventricosus TaxID=182803 RepID=A0A4Y2CIT6_ARAVE|nr:hypothetical protein AVEN_134900-1 [Araneus ventricosus]